MSPEAKLAQYAERIHLQDEDVDYLLSLVQEARGLGSVAGSAAEREACEKICLEIARRHPHELWARGLLLHVAEKIHARGASCLTPTVTPQRD